MFTNPDKNLLHLELQSGECVADIGCGAGGYALHAAFAVGAKGRVFAVDIKADLAAQVKREAERRGLSNVEALRGNAEQALGTRLADGSADAAIVSNILFEIEDRQVFVQELSRIVKEGGRVMLIDWLRSFGGLGPPESAVVPEENARALFEKNGYTVEKRFSAGEHHYGIICSK